MYRKIIKHLLASRGLELRKIASAQANVPGTFTTDRALERCVERGIQINTIVDVGASDSRWSKMCLTKYPHADYLLIEAQKEHQPMLEEFKNSHEKVDYVLAAAGDREGSIYFDNGDLFGGLASDKPFEKNCIEVPVVSLDKLIDERRLKGPFLLKLDTHGYELPILKGASELVKNAGLIVIETYNYKLTPDCLRYWEMANHMEKLGFLPIEMADLMLRERDNSFWQMDTFFIPSSREEFQTNTYA